MNNRANCLITCLCIATVFGLSCLAQSPASLPDYAVVVSDSTARDDSWRQVVEALRSKHNAAVITCSMPEVNSRDALRKLQPRYVCFVARPEELDQQYVRRIHLLSRQMDDDPYADFLWGIITGYTPADALRIAQASEPLVPNCGLTTIGPAASLQQFLALSDKGKGRCLRRELPLLATNTTLSGSTATAGSHTAWRAGLTNGAWFLWNSNRTEQAGGKGAASWSNLTATTSWTVLSNGIAASSGTTVSNGLSHSWQSVETNLIYLLGTTKLPGGGLAVWRTTFTNGLPQTWCQFETNSVATNGSFAQQFADYYNTHGVDCLITSGHASPFNVELSFGWGAVVCGNNELYAVDPPEFRRWIRLVGAGKGPGQPWYTAPDAGAARSRWATLAKSATPTTSSRESQGPESAIQLRGSGRPKVFLAVGNCFIGNPLRARDSMAVTWLSAGGVNQFVGYTLAPELGSAGWGTLQLWADPPGYNTLSEAVYLANQRVVRGLARYPELLALGNEEGLSPEELQTRLAAILDRVPANQRQNLAGLFRERDGLVLFGDPKWEARPPAAGDKLFRWSPAEGGGWQLTACSSTGYRTGNHPMFLLPERVPNARVIANAGLDVVVNDEFVLLVAPRLEKTKTYSIVIATGPDQPKTTAAN